jgi:hypothetical protein
MNEKKSAEEINNYILSILQSSDFTKTLESFSDEMIKPTMRLMAEIEKRKKRKKRKKS